LIVEIVAWNGFIASQSYGLKLPQPTGTRAVSSKWSPESAADFKAVNARIF
jgi:hypothetical protein